MLTTWHGVPIRAHGFFVGLGVLAALAVLALEVRRRRAWDERLLIVVACGLAGGSIGMRAGALVRHLEPGDGASLAQAWTYGVKSILGGLAGAYLGVLLGKRVSGYTARTGDLFAPAVALGMAIGRVGCFLTEAPGRATSLPWAIHLSPEQAARIPDCAACAAGAGMHPSFLYEIAFQLFAFLALLWLRPRVTKPGVLFTIYLAAYGGFRFLVELTRANETVWLGLTRSQWFLLPFLAYGIVRWLTRRRPAAVAHRELVGAGA